MDRKLTRIPLNRAARGMTLIEIMVVIMIIGMIATMVSVKVFSFYEEAKVTKAKADIAGFQSALGGFYLDNSCYPTTDQGLKALVEKPLSGPPLNKWRTGGYLDQDAVSRDPWGHEYIYTCPGLHSAEKYDISSLGRDGVEGGEGFDADINSWELNK